MAGKEKDITGQTFGFWTAVRAEKRLDTRPRWLFRCVCGKERVFLKSYITGGASNSCGCKHPHKATRTLPKYQASFNALYASYVRHAKDRQLSWKLSKTCFRQLTKGSCVYCGTPPKQVLKSGTIGPYNGDYTYNGIDRVDNAVGYVEHNCVSCCKICNIAKRSFPLHEFIEWLERLKSHTITEVKCAQI